MCGIFLRWKGLFALNSNRVDWCLPVRKLMQMQLYIANIKCIVCF